MPKSIKFKDDTYLDSTGIMHNRHKLSEILYPVGSIYMSTNSTNPATLFGGSWTQINGRFLYATNSSKETGGDTKTKTGGAGKTGNGGGGATDWTTLTIDQIPAHTHHNVFRSSWDWHTDTQGPRDAFNANEYHWYGSNENYNALHPTYSTGGGQGHRHGLSNHTHSIPAHTHEQNLPPYFTVYCWYRTA